MINLVVSVKDEMLIATLRGYPARLANRLEQAMNRVTIELQARTKEKLTGEVLHVRTGTLRRSINRRVERTPDGIVGAVGTNVAYGAAHEFGFKGNVTVRAHVRRLRTQGKLDATGKRKRGKLTGAVANVASYQMTMNLPERSFLRSALKELEPSVVKAIRNAAAEALK